MDGIVNLTVVHASTYTRKDGTPGTKLYVPIGNIVWPVFVQGDATAWAGCVAPFKLGSYDNQLRLSLYHDQDA